MSEGEKDFWGRLFVVDEKGRLGWRLEVEADIDDSDPRKLPERYVEMCGNLCESPDYSPILNIKDLTPVADNEFVNEGREVATTEGLLCLLDKFSIEWPRPEEIMVVGALTPNSFLSVLSWAKRMKWEGCRITLVDRSPIPIETLKLMIEMNYINWPGELRLARENILTYHSDRKPDIIIADILNTWMVPKFFPSSSDSGIDSPYRFYKMFLQRMANFLKPEGWFLSRCLLFPDSVEEVTMAGLEGEEVFKALYQKEFDKVHFFKVVNAQSGFRHLYFACGV